MQAGQLYQAVTIEQKSVVRDADFGSEKIVWIPFAANIRANASDLHGAEAVRQNLRVGTRGVKVSMRWRPGVTTDMRIRDRDGRLFQIISIAEIQPRRGLDVLCEEFTV